MQEFLVNNPYAFWLMLLAMIPVVFVQNMAFTWVSRSRNGGNVAYHRRASWCSNGVWFVTQLLFLSTMLPALMSGAWWKVAIVGLVYTLATTEGSCLMMARLLKTETGDKRVGATPTVVQVEPIAEVSDPLAYIFAEATPLLVSDDPFTKTGLAEALMVANDGEVKFDTIYLLLNRRGYRDFLASDRENIFDPVTKYDILETGCIGRLLGIKVYTDAHLRPSLQDNVAEHRWALYGMPFEDK